MPRRRTKAATTKRSFSEVENPETTSASASPATNNPTTTIPTTTNNDITNNKDTKPATRRSERSRSMTTTTTTSSTTAPQRHPPNNNNNAQPAAKKKPSPKQEKRLSRYRSSPSKAISIRIERAASQRLYLIRQSDDRTTDHPIYGGPFVTFNILGSTGNVYDVELSKCPSCSCPDHLKGNLCKHILFVMLKVVGLSSTNHLVYQSALLTSELDEILELLDHRRATVFSTGGGQGVVANERVQKRFHDVVVGGAKDDGTSVADEGDDAVLRKPLEDNTECPICFDRIGSESATYCRGTCGTNFHKQCIIMWLKSGTGRNQSASCPACRQDWVGDEVAKKRGHDGGETSEGYINFGQLQGQSRERDTSTYHDYDYYEWKRRSRRRW